MLSETKLRKPTKAVTSTKQVLLKKPDFRIRAALTRKDRAAAYRFVATEYRRAGLMNPKSPNARIVRHYGAPRALTLIAENQEHDMVGSLTVVPDSRLGLPLDGTFKAEADALRLVGVRMCEYTGLSVGKKACSSRAVVLQLMRIAGLYADGILRASDGCCLVNPRHVRFYRDVFRYESFGPERPCAQAGGAPAIPLRMDFGKTKRAYRQRRIEVRGIGALDGFFFGSEAQNIKCRLATLSTTMSQEDVEYFFGADKRSRV